MTNNLVPEIDALNELMRLGINEIGGKSINDLIQPSISRIEGINRLRLAHEHFYSATDVANVQATHKIMDAETSLKTAISSLEQAREGYDADAFQTVRVLIETQLEEANILMHSIQLWWQQQIYEQLFQARLSFIDPVTDTSAQGAADHLNKARSRLDEWPPTESFQSIRENSKSAIDELETFLNDRKASLLQNRISELEDWLQMAEGYLVPVQQQEIDNVFGSADDGEGSEEDFTAIYASFSCLSQAKILLESLSLQQVEGLQEKRTQYDKLLKQARAALHTGTGKKEQNLKQLEKQVEGKARGKLPQEFLQQDKGNRSLIDNLRYNLYLFPGFIPQAGTKQLILRRQDNLLQARLLLNEVDGQSTIPYTKARMLYELDPDDKTVQHLWSKAEKERKVREETVEAERIAQEKEYEMLVSDYKTLKNTMENDVVQPENIGQMISSLNMRIEKFQERTGFTDKESSIKAEDMTTYLSKVEKQIRDAGTLIERWEKEEEQPETLVAETAGSSTAAAPLFLQRQLAGAIQGRLNKNNDFWTDDFEAMNKARELHVTFSAQKK